MTRVLLRRGVPGRSEPEPEAPDRRRDAAGAAPPVSARGPGTGLGAGGAEIRLPGALAAQLARQIARSSGRALPGSAAPAGA